MVRTVNLITDVLRPFVKNRLLITGLAKSEIPEFNPERLEWVVRLRTEPQANTHGEKSAGVPPGGPGSGTIEVKLRTLGEGDQLALASEIPAIGIAGGLLGVQALYLMLENFWRNLVKHNRSNVIEACSQGRLQVFIELADDIGKPFWKVTLWANVQTPKNVVGEIQSILSSGIIDEETGELLPAAWGTKEMLVAAAHLIGKPLEDVQEKGRGILDVSRRQGYLCYHFRLLKPLRLSIIGGDSDTELKKQLATKGVFVWQADNAPSVIATEYLVFRPGAYRRYESGCQPLKVSNRQVDPNILTEDNELLAFEAVLEREFARNLLDGASKVYLGIRGGESADRRILEGEFRGDGLLTVEDLDNVGHDSEIAAKVEQLLEEGAFVLLFDRHGDLSGDSYRTVASIIRNRSVDNDGIGLFWEPFGAGTYTAFSLQHCPSQAAQKLHFAWQLVSAAALRIVILDERIQQTLDRSGLRWCYMNGPSFDPLYCLSKMRIHIPSAGVQDQCPLESPVEEKVFDFIKSHTPHVLCIHVGILDKLGFKNADSVNDFVTRLRGETRSLHRVVLHSGRGIPPNVPETKVPFMSYTAIEHWVTSRDLKSKYGLVQEVLAARGVKR